MVETWKLTRRIRRGCMGMVFVWDAEYLQGNLGKLYIEVSFVLLYFLGKENS